MEARGTPLKYLGTAIRSAWMDGVITIVTAVPFRVAPEAALHWRQLAVELGQAIGRRRGGLL